ncbi:uncharacterized protein LOC143296174 [Babylonia areolata]|uniref:uncharacterized protein LOC143296174 n=1 Tax=Babylonia areolata TaxID=304850 RepID=UPI003FD2EAE4
MVIARHGTERVSSVSRSGSTMPPTGAVISLDLNCTTVTTTTNTTTAAYDAEGAMKFTVALVLVFGVGVIGMLGFYHQRNLDEDLSNKEADDFVKRFERKRYNMEKQYQKKIMRQLIESFFARTLRVKSFV